MKIFSITAKNLKLLARSKTSLLVIIFAPLLIMLLVGFAFNNPSTSKLNVGYYAPQKTELTTSFLDALTSNTQFLVVEYQSAELCSDMIAQAKIHLCIVFPEHLALDNTANDDNEIIFYVDQSRTNFVYAVIDTVSSKIEFTSTQLSRQLTNNLLTVIDHTKTSNTEVIAKIIARKSAIDSINTELKNTQSKLDTLDLSSEEVDFEAVKDATTALKTDVTALKESALDVVDTGKEAVDDLDPYVSGNGTNILSDFDDALDDYEGDIGNASSQATENIDTTLSLLDSVSSGVDILNNKLSNARSATGSSADAIADAQKNLAEIKTDLDTMKASLEAINAEINSIKVTSADSIVNPIHTTIRPVSTKSNNLNFIFPYVVILIIVFISIMLSSSIILMEKTSRAYFRTFTTPTKDIVFVMSIFLTGLVVAMLQIAFIMGLAYYFLDTTLSANLWLSIGVLLASVTLFTLIGMIIGYLSNSQEAATMASISIGSVFLFLSNLILPLETMAQSIQEIAKYNPYVICSELLKKITLFGVDWSVLVWEFELLGIYIAVAFIVTVLAQKISKIHYIGRKPIAKMAKKDEIVDHYFKLKSGMLVRNEKELLSEIKKMDDKTFAEYVTHDKNDFETWLELNKHKDLAKILSSCKTRGQMIEMLEKHKGKFKK